MGINSRPTKIARHVTPKRYFAGILGSTNVPSVDEVVLLYLKHVLQVNIAYGRSYYKEGANDNNAVIDVELTCATQFAGIKWGRFTRPHHCMFYWTLTSSIYKGAPLAVPGCAAPPTMMVT
jgi:hypothetical protein